MLKKKLIQTILLTTIILLPILKVNAVTISSKNSCFAFNETDGSLDKSHNGNCNFRSGYILDAEKSIDGAPAYCMQWAADISSNSDYKLDDSASSQWAKVSATHRMYMGCIIQVIKEDLGDTTEAYAMTAAALNSYYKEKLSSVVNDTGSSYNYYSGQSNPTKKAIPKIKEYIDAGIAYAKSLKVNTKIPAISFDEEEKELTAVTSGGYFISSKVTLGNAAEGSTDKLTDVIGLSDVTYTISLDTDNTSGIPNNGQVAICTNKAGTNCTCLKGAGSGTGCEQSIKLTKRNTAYSFYLKITGPSLTESNYDNISIGLKAEGEKTANYYSVKRYTRNDASQKLIVQATGSKKQTVSANVKFTIDNPSEVKHKINVKKVNEEGSVIAGANLSLYRANKDDESKTQVGNALATMSAGKSSLSWSTTATDNNDDFYNYQYCVKETAAPNGYILSDKIDCYTPTPNSEPVKTCLKNGEGEVNDLNYCKATYQCKQEGYTLSGNECQKSVTSDPTIKTCGEGQGTLNEATGKCELLIGDATIPEGGTEPTCSGDVTPVDGKCYTYSEPNLSCSEEQGIISGTTCVKTEVLPATCVGGQGVEDNKYCESMDQYTYIEQNNNNITIQKINNKTNVAISKKGITGDDEVPGATLKVCSKENWESQKENCTAEKNTDGDDVSWVSESEDRVWSGLNINTDYVIVEQIPPSGYIKVATGTPFKIDSNGNITSGSTTITSADALSTPLVIKNQLNYVDISKDDIATSSELPGATITICETYKDGDEYKPRIDQYTNECVNAVLAKGDSATWISGTEPHKVSGLPAGTYALVEKIAPEGYSTAETIIFTMKEDGTLADANGKSLADKKIVMHDKKITSPPTGMLIIYLVSALTVFSIIAGTSSYYLIKKKKANQEI